MAEAALPVFAFGHLLKLLVALAVTIALFGVMVVVMKKLQLGTGQGNSLIKVLGAVPLGGKEKIWLLEIAGERIVVGSSAGSVSRIHVLAQAAGGDSDSDLAEPQPSGGSDAAEPAVPRNFSETLLTFVRGAKQ